MGLHNGSYQTLGGTKWRGEGKLRGIVSLGMRAEIAGGSGKGCPGQGGGSPT